MEWLNSFFTYVSKVFPRITFIPSYSKGVLFSGFTGKVYEVSGILFWWPLFSYLCSYPIIKQAKELRQQSLTTFDCIPISVLPVVEYSVSDVIKCATSVYDYKEILDNAGRHTIKDLLISRSFDEIVEEIDDIDKTIFDAIKTEMAQYGIQVYNAYISDITINLPIKVWKEETISNNSMMEY